MSDSDWKFDENGNKIDGDDSGGRSFNMSSGDTGSLILFGSGLYALLHHSAVHSAIYENIHPEAFAGMVSWGLIGLEASVLIGSVLIILGLFILFLGLLSYLF